MFWLVCMAKHEISIFHSIYARTDNEENEKYNNRISREMEMNKIQCSNHLTVNQM